MNTQERTTDKRRHEEFTDLFNILIHAARPTSREQLAAAVTRGLDDPTAVSKDTLDKICEGAPRAKFPVHKLPRLYEITGNATLLQWLARESGFLLIPQPRSKDLELHGLRTLVKEHAEACESLCIALDRASEGGTTITKAEAVHIAQQLDELAAAAIALKHEINHQAVKA